jgi:N-acetyl-gamma-glutamyl-phosphate reductase
MADKMRLGIVGATGYVGMELLRLLAGHRGFEITRLVSQSYAGQAFSDIYPAFRGLIDTKLTDLNVQDLAESCDIVVTALPHGVSSKIVPDLLSLNLKVLDHSGDFRYRHQETYENAYGLSHPRPDLLSKAVYGLPEIYRDKIVKADLVANPGCYPTCSLLALMPLLKSGLIKTGNIIIDAYSGISGAGRKADLAFSFCEAQDSIKPYGVIGHRHTSEIEQEAGFLSGQKNPLILTFTPHLAPFKRGMLATVYADQSDAGSETNLQQIFEEFYSNEQFVRVMPSNKTPETRNVAYTNFADIAVARDDRTGKIKIMSAIDNLGKGASGQALQSLNLMCGLPENTGLLSAGGAI